MLDANFKRLQKSVHPDKFGRRSGKEQELSADASTQLNVAYRILRGAATRAQYLLQLHGIDAIGEAAGREGRVDPELLMEVMEARETLEDASVTAAAVAALNARVLRAIGTTVADLNAAFRARDHPRAADITVALQYYTKLKSEIDDWLAARETHARAPGGHAHGGPPSRLA